MTRRDLQWKAGGFALMAVSCALCMAVDGSPLMLLFFPLALLGLPLMIHANASGRWSGRNAAGTATRSTPSMPRADVGADRAAMASAADQQRTCYGHRRRSHVTLVQPVGFSDPG